MLCRQKVSQCDHYHQPIYAGYRPTCIYEYAMVPIRDWERRPIPKKLDVRSSENEVLHAPWLFEGQHFFKINKQIINNPGSSYTCNIHFETRNGKQTKLQQNNICSRMFLNPPSTTSCRRAWRACAFRQLRRGRPSRRARPRGQRWGYASVASAASSAPSSIHAGASEEFGAEMQKSCCWKVKSDQDFHFKSTCEQ